MGEDRGKDGRYASKKKEADAALRSDNKTQPRPSGLLEIEEEYLTLLCCLRIVRDDVELLLLFNCDSVSG